MFLLVLAAAAPAGCYSHDLDGDPPPEAVATAEAPIISGTTVTPDGSGHVMLSIPVVGSTRRAVCSGTLLTNSWVLTARHCVDARIEPALATPVTATLTMGAQVATMAEIQLFPSNASPDNSMAPADPANPGGAQMLRYDIALVRLSTPFAMNGKTSGYRRPLYVAPPETLVNAFLDCYGYGRVTAAGGSGTLRRAYFIPNGATATEYRFPRNDVLQEIAQGDSGGGCFTLSGELTGVHSFTFPAGVAHDHAVAAYYSWIESVMMAFGPGRIGHNYFCVGNEECALGDVNGDGRDDLIAFVKSTQSGAAFGDVWISLATGTGFAPAQWANDYFCVGNEVCKVGDVNGDHMADLIAFVKNTQGGAGFGDVWVAISYGSGFFQPVKMHDYFCVNDEECAVGDVDGDGLVDLVAFGKATAGAGNGDVWVAKSQGWSFGAGEKWHDDFCTMASSQCAVGDVDGDRRADLVAFWRTPPGHWGEGLVEVALSTSSGVEASQIWAEGFCFQGEECMLGDVDGNAAADLVSFVRSSQSGPFEGDVRVALSLGFSFGLGVRWHDWFSVSSEVPRVGDVDGDGRADVVTFLRDTWVPVDPSSRGRVWFALSRI